ncbi:MAG: hypothetical protein J2P54_00825 [Bradyrhizobiaceae bacterium]|nr:hypothetical protein [Bradyrhizobiaceae bacterium]
MARRGNARSAFEAVRTAIGAELKKLYSDILREPIPDRMAELLKQLDDAAESKGIDSQRRTSGKILDA